MTQRNDPGFELHTVISTLNDIVELLESKLGTTDSPAQNSPLANTVLASLSNGKTGYRQVSTNDIAGGAISTANIGDLQVTTAKLVANAVSQSGAAVGSSSSPSYTLATYVDLAEMSVTLTTAGGDLLVWFSGAFVHSTAGTGVTVALSLDGATEVQDRIASAPVGGYGFVIALNHKFVAPSAASHTVKVRIKTSATGAQAFLTQRSMLVVEVKR